MKMENIRVIIGILMVLAVIHKAVNAKCKYNIDAETRSTILSPGYTNATYPPSVICSWLILAPQHQQIMLQFNDFSLENTRRCSRDYLRIYDGVDTFAHLLGNFCGHVIPPDVISTGNTMLVIFHTDATNEDIGFNISYTNYIPIVPFRPYKDDGCHGDIKLYNDSIGYISSPGYDGHSFYDNRLNCSWLIEAPAGSIIRLKFQDFVTEKIAGCTYDYLAVYDGGNETTWQLAQLCGLQFPQDIFSSGNQLFLKFVTDADVSSVGVNMTFEFLPDTGSNKCDHFRCGDGSCVLSQMVCNNFAECPDGTDESMCESKNATCGKPYITPSELNAKIVGGREAIAHSWPWMVSLQVNGTHTCGGAIIDQHWVVSAAHCFEANRHAIEWTVVAGKHHEVRTDVGEQTRDVERIIVHSDYYYLTTVNDISLIKVRQPFEFNTTVGAVCLPIQEPDDGAKGIVTGWGDIQGTCCPDVLKQVSLPVVDRDVCIQPDYLGNQITTDMFCAGYDIGGKDACQGDSGGPFVMKDNVSNVWRIEGITSFGSLCAAPKLPGVYTNVYNFVSWIRQQVAIN